MKSVILGHYNALNCVMRTTTKLSCYKREKCTFVLIFFRKIIFTSTAFMCAALHLKWCKMTRVCLSLALTYFCNLFLYFLRRRTGKTGDDSTVCPRHHGGSSNTLQLSSLPQMTNSDQVEMQRKPCVFLCHL